MGFWQNLFRDKSMDEKLITAAGYGKLSQVKEFLAKKADVNAARTDDGFNPLIMASLKDHAEVVKLLLEAGADVNSTDNKGETPWMKAF